jgi:hypothetical protein
VLIVFHRKRCEHPFRSLELEDGSSSSEEYLKSDALNRSDKCEGTRGIIFGR